MLNYRFVVPLSSGSEDLGAIEVCHYYSPHILSHSPSSASVIYQII